MIRVFVVRLSPSEHTILITVHHIACDVLSFDVLWREIEHLYERFQLGRPFPSRRSLP